MVNTQLNLMNEKKIWSTSLIPDLRNWISRDSFTFYNWNYYSSAGYPHFWVNMVSLLCWWFCSIGGFEGATQRAPPTTECLFNIMDSYIQGWQSLPPAIMINNSESATDRPFPPFLFYYPPPPIPYLRIPYNPSPTPFPPKRTWYQGTLTPSCWQNDRRLWKHYLPAISLAVGNYINTTQTRIPTEKRSLFFLHRRSSEP